MKGCVGKFFAHIVSSPTLLGNNAAAIGGDLLVWCYDTCNGASLFFCLSLVWDIYARSTRSLLEFVMILGLVASCGGVVVRGCTGVVVFCCHPCLPRRLLYVSFHGIALSGKVRNI